MIVRVQKGSQNHYHMVKALLDKLEQIITLLLPDSRKAALIWKKNDSSSLAEKKKIKIARKSKNIYWPLPSSLSLERNFRHLARSIKLAICRISQDIFMQNEIFQRKCNDMFLFRFPLKVAGPQECVQKTTAWLILLDDSAAYGIHLSYGMIMCHWSSFK